MEKKKVEFDYPHEWTKKAIDADGYYKLNDLTKIYNDPKRSRIGQEPTDPPIYNKDGFIVSKDGVSCFDGPYPEKVGTKTYEVVRVYPNIPHKIFVEHLSHVVAKMLVDKMKKELE